VQSVTPAMASRRRREVFMSVSPWVLQALHRRRPLGDVASVLAPNGVESNR
jgi:hypothetical protein